MKEFGSKKKKFKKHSFENLDNFSLIGFCICIDGAFMSRPTPTTACDGAIWYFAYTI